jgi:hypothetical protein
MLDSAQTLIGTHRDGGIGVGDRQVGADDIDAVERILFAWCEAVHRCRITMAAILTMRMMIA